MALHEILMVAALPVLIGYLFFKQRQRDFTPSPPADLSDWKGHGLDTAPLQPRIQKLRDDPLAALPVDSRDVRIREGLLARARRALVSLPYFRDKQPEHEDQVGTG